MGIQTSKDLESIAKKQDDQAFKPDLPKLMSQVNIESYNQSISDVTDLNYVKNQKYTKILERKVSSLASCIEIYGERHPNTAKNYNDIGLAYDSLGQYEKALKCFLKSLNLCEDIYGAKHPNTAAIHNNIGGIYHSLGQYQKAQKSYLKSIVICQAM